MDSTLTKVCDTYIYNRDEMRRILRSHGIPMHLMGAAVLTALGESPDEDKILAAEMMLKSKETEDSPIRGAIKSVTTVHMMLADDMEAYHNELRRTHDLIHVSRGEDDERYYMAAMMMSEKISNMQEILFMVERAGAIHEGMGKSFLSLEDKSVYVTAAYAAASGVFNVRAYLDDVRDCESRLKKSGIKRIVSDDMCMILALMPGTTQERCDRILGLIRAFRDIDMKFERGEELEMLAFLAGLDMPADDIASAVHDADEFLKLHSGFTKGEGCILRHVYAAMLVTMTYAPEKALHPIADNIKGDVNILKRMVLMQSQSVMHIQMKYVDKKDLNI